MEVRKFFSRKSSFGKLDNQNAQNQPCNVIIKRFHDMSGECNKCDEHALDCLCYTKKPPECSLIHSRIPKKTERIVWLEKENKWIHEIIWVCKEGCRE